jgi:hypothetical protein
MYPDAEKTVDLMFPDAWTGDQMFPDVEVPTR